MGKLFITFNNTVYSDAGLTQPITEPIEIFNTTMLPDNVYFASMEYIGTGENQLGDPLWTVRFTYPADLNSGVINNGIYDE